jgi:ATP-dependent protease Clp ATPase subunit
MGVCERIIAEPKPDRTVIRRHQRLRCSFCNISATDARHLIAGPAVYICEGCVVAARTVADSASPAKGPRQVVLRPAHTEDHECAFCSKAPQHVESMVKGGRGRICGECLQLCEDIVAEAS